jgi:hypothetical protein
MLQYISMKNKSLPFLIMVIISILLNSRTLWARVFSEGYVLMMTEERIFAIFDKEIGLEAGSILGIDKEGEIVAKFEVTNVSHYPAEPKEIVVEARPFRKKDLEKVKENDKVRVISYEKGLMEEPKGEVREKLEKVLGVKLPYGSQVDISGRKVIEMKYGHSRYFEEEKEDETPSSGFAKGIDVEQELQVRVRGNIGERITANVDYDDTTREKRKVSLIYKGAEDDIIQEAAFGDLLLTLPETKYVLYNKHLFGVKVDSQIGRWRLLAIGTKTKGESKTKKFYGEAGFHKKDILDIQYRRRRYYLIDTTLDFDLYDIVTNTEKIYIDDKNVANNTDNTLYTSEGDFDLQYPGEDYTVDYDKGIISFRKSLGSNHILKIDYQYKDAYGNTGSVSGKIIKHETLTPEDEEYELRNYYYLGAKDIEREDFLLQILDAQRNEVNIEDYPYEIDYEFGILKFKEREPFPGEVYAVPPENLYTIHVEYEKKTKTYMIEPNIVLESEIVRIDGRVLKRSSDYLIDYDSGYITFFIKERIDKETEIEIDYELEPFGMGGKENLLGLRAETILGQNFKLGSTYIYLGGIPEEDPRIGSEPESQQVLNLDAQYAFPLGPLKVAASGEFAFSRINPNTADKAIIDDMESIQVESNISLESDNWKRTSPPEGTSLLNRGSITLKERETYADEINPHLSENEKREILILDYDLPSVDSWEGITYPLSSSGYDYSERSYIEFWLWGDNKGEELNIDLGTVDEDTDGDGHLDTEDRNEDGKLNAGEDTGYSSGEVRVGEENGLLDTEDLDGDGYLDRVNNYYEYTLTIDWEGWKHISIPLKDDPLDEVVTAKIGSPDWESVKHLKIWLKGSSLQGRIEIDSLKIVGHTWEEGVSEEVFDKFTVKHINNQDNPETYIPPREIEEDEFEQALSLIYDLSENKKGYTQYTYFEGEDYSDYEYLGFSLYGDNGEEDFFIQMGSDEDNYFEYVITVNWSGWEKKRVSLSAIPGTGNPSWDNIKEIRLGIIGRGRSGEIWINDLYLDEVRKKGGQAKRIDLRAELPEVMTFSAEYEDIASDFETIGRPKLGQEISSYKFNSRFYKWKWLPLWGGYERKKTITPLFLEEETELVKKEEEGEVIREKKNFGLSLAPEKGPELTLEYKNEKDEFSQVSEVRDKTTYFSSLNWRTPFGGLLPRDLGIGYKRIEETRRGLIYQALNNSTTESELTDDWSVNMLFEPANIISFRPTYNLREVREEGKLESKNQRLGLKVNLKLASFFKPSLNYEGRYFENTTIYPRKNATSRGSLELRLPLRFAFPFTLNTSYKTERESIYEDMEEDLDFTSQVGLKSEEDLAKGRLKMLSEKNSLSLKGRWTPTKFLSASCRYNTQDLEKATTGTKSITQNRLWPELDLTFKDFTFLGKPSSLITRYSRKEIIKEDISRALIYKPSLNWRIDWTPKLVSLLNLSYSERKEEEGKVTRMDSTFSPGLKIDYTVDLPPGFRLPLIGTIGTPDGKNKIRWIGEVRGDFSANENYYAKDETDKYTLSLSAECLFRQNTELTFGIKHLNLANRTEPTKSYSGYEGTFKLVLRF